MLMLLPYVTLLIGLLAAVICISPAKAGNTCLRLEFGEKSTLYPVAGGAAFTISFVHSIYGMEVQEQLRITPTGFETAKLRYAELRLAEFYGHDGAKLEQGWWIVDNSGKHLPRLHIRASKESALVIFFGEQRIRLGNNYITDGSVRIVVTLCGGYGRG
jgi:hypothetical protein